MTQGWGNSFDIVARALGAVPLPEGARRPPGTIILRSRDGEVYVWPLEVAIRDLFPTFVEEGGQQNG